MLKHGKIICLRTPTASHESIITSFFIRGSSGLVWYLSEIKVKGHSYAYLVRNVWDNKNGRVRQEIVKYLGRSSKVALEDIPKEFQKDPNVVTFIACHSSDAEKMEFTMKEEMLASQKK